MADNVFLYENKIPEIMFFNHYRKSITDVPLHWHNYIEIELVMGGTAEHIHNGVFSTLKRGCVSVLRINDYHSIKNTQDLDVLNLSIKDTSISEKIVASLNSVEGNLAFDLNPELFDTLVFFCEAVIVENSNLNKNEDYIKKLLECIFILLLKQAQTKSKPLKRQHNDQLNIAVNYLHNHFRENPSLNTTAKIAHYSPTHFSHVFHKKIGKSYNDYLNDLKISYAKQLLTTTDLKIIDAGYQSGFNSYNNFYSTFKNYTGLSPADYKKKKASDTSTTGYSYSWRFGLAYTNIETNPAYVFIDTDVLEPQTEYTFSYCYSQDYIIAFERIQNYTTKQSIKIISQSTTDLNDKRRTSRVDITFKTRGKAPYRIILKMGKGLNNTDCKYRLTTLSALTLLKTGEQNGKNYAANYNYANGNVSWTDNSDAYDCI